MKELIIILAIVLGVQTAKGQNLFEGIRDHTPMMNESWEAVNKLRYKVTHQDNETIYTPFFPTELKAIENKVVTLPGYLIPLNGGQDHETFMLSVLPIMQCMFCGQNDIPPMVEVFMKNGNKVRFTEAPIKVKGRVKLNANTTEGNSEIQILDAEVAE